ncbi:hypothetical protein CJD_1865 [Clostridium perfringens D str. JGS1721]|uniref:Uncharacterized protein n=1 Tax=Clostridium perfringens D str. JGS1721 TaxID=488537 RepID=B1V1G7_CLOPF|nr:hypothetical protein [Clostridium perfringens]EDT72281.1 hypothetical protein CJD_1865 [Clostridium perfringens D str. JGS1721]
MEILIILCTILSAMAMIISIIAMSTLKYLDTSKETSKNNIYDEVVEDSDDTIQKAIIILGDRKIEVEVDFYEIDYNIIKITDKYGEVYLTYTKNVLLTSEYRI